MGNRTGDKVIEAREVVRGRRQWKARPARNGAVTDRLESAFTQQLGGGADQRVPPTFSACQVRLMMCGANSRMLWMGVAPVSGLP